MKIGIDIRSLADGIHTGVQEYALNKVEELISKNKQDEFVLFLNSFKKPKTDLTRWEKYENVTLKISHWPNKLLNLCLLALTWPKLDKLIGGVDEFFAPNVSFLAVSHRCKLTLTIHDLSFERFPEFFSLKRRLWHFIINPRKICQRANKILAVSHSTKNDLIQLYGIDEGKIKVEYPMFRPDRFLKPVRSSSLKLPKDFILFLGTIEPRKNIIGLIQAFEKVAKENKEINLVIAGNLGWNYKRILQTIKQSSVKNRIFFIGSVREEDKPGLYRAARFFVYPSFFEGFGFPPLEAMASGKATITSNNSSMAEVVGKGAFLVDPYRIDQIAKAIKALWEDKNIRSLYEKKGRELINDTWLDYHKNS